MLKKNKIVLAMTLSVATLTSWGVANAALPGAPDYGSPAATVTDATNVAEVQPKFIFSYNPAMSGVLVDITEGLDATGNPVDKNGRSAITQCGNNVAFEYVPLADMNCTSSGCEWLTPVALADKHSYYVVYDEVVAGATSLATRASCKTVAANAGAVFSVDTSTAPPTPVPTAPPKQVVITPQTTACNGSLGFKRCTIEFKHDNSPSASHYRVWINDKNGIQIDEDALSAKADQSVDINGWFEVDDGTAGPITNAPGDAGAAVTCAADLAGTRTCYLEIGRGHPAYSPMKNGSKVKVWVRAWNAKGYAPWSDSVEIQLN